MQSRKSGPVSDSHIYVAPTKLVKTVDQMGLWEHSEAYHEYLGFIGTLNDSIKGKSNTVASVDASEEIKKICNLLDSLDNWIDEIPPIQQPQRFGNQAFRQWCQKLRDEATNLLQVALPVSLHPAVCEISTYLVEGFGNSTRIDYGTGHELSFLMFLCALFKIGFLNVSDAPATAGKVFVRYLEIARKLQTTYNMEPAGSHGVWSLDDHQFVPFIWGSAQFIGNVQFEPTCFLKENILNKHASEYMFLSCIQYINKVKTGPFAEHSNQLWSISAVSNWGKINSGLIKMYRAEVLAKFPLVQHIYFGSIFTLDPFVPLVVPRPQTSFQALNKFPVKCDPTSRPSAISSNLSSYSSSDGLASRNTSKSNGSRDTTESGTGHVHSVSREVSNSDRSSIRDTDKFEFKVPSDFDRGSKDAGNVDRKAAEHEAEEEKCVPKISIVEADKNKDTAEQKHEKHEVEEDTFSKKVSIAQRDNRTALVDDAAGIPRND